jgi:hypothetical protein
MTVTITAGAAGSKLTSLAVLQTAVTALAALAPTPSNQQLLKQKAEELVRGCIDANRITAAAIIAQFPTVFTAAWLLKYAPDIAQISANLSSNAANPTLLAAAQGHAVDVALYQGKLNAYSDVLATMN